MIIFVLIIFSVMVYINFKKYPDLKTYSIDKGKYGEEDIYNELEKLTFHKKIIKNLYLLRDENKTTEIDVVMICSKGVFVFESKNYSGWIFGNKNDMYWKQTFPNGKKFEFYNPIKQNENHIKHMKKIIENENIISYIIMGNECTIKNQELLENENIFHRWMLLDKIQYDLSEMKDILSELEINNIYIKLKYYSGVKEEMILNHINNIETNR